MDIYHEHSHTESYYPHCTHILTSKQIPASVNNTCQCKGDNLDGKEVSQQFSFLPESYPKSMINVQNNIYNDYMKNTTDKKHCKPIHFSTIDYKSDCFDKTLNLDVTTIQQIKSIVSQLCDEIYLTLCNIDTQPNFLTELNYFSDTSPYTQSNVHVPYESDYPVVSETKCATLNYFEDANMSVESDNNTILYPIRHLKVDEVFDNHLRNPSDLLSKSDDFSIPSKHVNVSKDCKERNLPILCNIEFSYNKFAQMSGISDNKSNNKSHSLPTFDDDSIADIKCYAGAFDNTTQIIHKDTRSKYLHTTHDTYYESMNDSAYATCEQLSSTLFDDNSNSDVKQSLSTRYIFDVNTALFCNHLFVDMPFQNTVSKTSNELSLYDNSCNQGKQISKCFYCGITAPENRMDNYSSMLFASAISLESRNVNVCNYVDDTQNANARTDLPGKSVCTLTDNESSNRPVPPADQLTSSSNPSSGRHFTVSDTSKSTNENSDNDDRMNNPEQDHSRVNTNTNQQTNLGIHFLSLNVGGLEPRLKSPDLVGKIKDNDITCLVETKFDDVDDLTIDGYTSFFKNRKKFVRKSGGTAVIVKNSHMKYIKFVETLTNKNRIEQKLLHHYRFVQFPIPDESIIFELCLPNQPTVVCATVYVPPQGSTYMNRDIFLNLSDTLSY